MSETTVSNGDNPSRFCRFCGEEMPTVDMHAPGIWRSENDCELALLRDLRRHVIAWYENGFLVSEGDEAINALYEHAVSTKRKVS